MNEKEVVIMNKKIRWITETAIMLALLVTLQALTKPMGQLVTGSCVNGVLAVAALVGGLGSGLTVALISPVLAFLLGIAPQIITVPAIMAGNALFAWLLQLLADKTGKHLIKQVAAWLVAAVAKFAALYLLVVQVICGLASGVLLGQKLGEAVLLAPPMLEKLPAMFTWPQLVTALIGGGAALAITPLLRKALRK